MREVSVRALQVSFIMNPTLKGDPVRYLEIYLELGMAQCTMYNGIVGYSGIMRS